MASNHWTTGDERNFFPRGIEHGFSELPAGIYDLKNSLQGLYFRSRKVQDLSELIRFENTQVDEAIAEIKSFWTKKQLFNKYNFPFRRGILLYGPPGSGKSCAIKMIIDDVVKMNGIAIMFCNPGLFSESMDSLRQIQKDTPVVVIIEDIDGWLDSYESTITDMLDGHSGYENIVFLATTNNINILSDRIKNRPSRFDKRINIGPPNLETRKEYISNLINKYDDFKHIQIDVWANDSEGLTFAHIKELFLSVCFFDCDYKLSLEKMIEMTNYNEDYSMKRVLKGKRTSNASLKEAENSNIYLKEKKHCSPEDPDPFDPAPPCPTDLDSYFDNNKASPIPEQDLSPVDEYE